MIYGSYIAEVQRKNPFHQQQKKELELSVFLSKTFMWRSDFFFVGEILILLLKWLRDTFLLSVEKSTPTILPTFGRIEKKFRDSIELLALDFNWNVNEFHGENSVDCILYNSF